MKTVRVIGQAGIGRGTTVTDPATGQSLQCVERIGIEPFGADDIVRVNLTVGLAEIDIEGTPTFFLTHPRTGEMREVAAIRLADGEVIEFKEPA